MDESHQSAMFLQFSQSKFKWNENYHANSQFKYGFYMCNKPRCTYCPKYAKPQMSFKSTVTNISYKINGYYNCESKWVVYCIECKACHLQYVGSTIDFKDRMRCHKSNIKNNKIDDYYTQTSKLIKHFNHSCNYIDSPIENFRYFIIDGLSKNMYENENIPKCYKDAKMFEKEKYWQAQIRTIFDGLNGTHDWYTKSVNRRNFIDKE